MSRSHHAQPSLHVSQHLFWALAARLILGNWVGYVRYISTLTRLLWHSERKFIGCSQLFQEWLGKPSTRSPSCCSYQRSDGPNVAASPPRSGKAQGADQGVVSCCRLQSIQGRKKQLTVESSSKQMRAAACCRQGECLLLSAASVFPSPLSWESPDLARLVCHAACIATPRVLGALLRWNCWKLCW